MGGGLAPDILSSIVEKDQVHTLMNLKSFLADAIAYNNRNTGAYLFCKGTLGYGYKAGVHAVNFEQTIIGASWVFEPLSHTGCAMK